MTAPAAPAPLSLSPSALLANLPAPLAPLPDLAALRAAFPGLPGQALSIRQPWASFIVHGLKPVENRSWPTRYRGPVLIHAGTRPADRFEGEEEFWQEVLGQPFPEDMPAALFPMGGIVGVADIVDCVVAHPSPWFFGPMGFVLANPRPLPFTPCRGALGFFRVFP